MIHTHPTAQTLTQRNNGLHYRITINNGYSVKIKNIKILLILSALFLLASNEVKSQIQYVAKSPNKTGNLIGSSGAPFFLNAQNRWENMGNGQSTIQYNKDYQFNIPTNATILGIQVICDVIISNLIDSSVYLLKNNTVVGNDGAFHFPIIFAPSISWGGNSDLWGTTWTPNEINDSTFGVHFRIKEINGNHPFGWVDASPVEIGVYYEVPATVNVNSFEENNTFKIYPNPAKDFIEVNFKTQSKSHEIEILDIQGRILQSKNITENKCKFNLQEYPKGLYFVRIRTENNYWTEKVMISK